MRLQQCRFGASAIMVSMENLTTAAAALLIATGIAGLLVPVLPGLFCVLVGVLVWAIGHSGPGAWTFFGAACVLAAIGYVVQYLVPGRQLSRAGVPKRSSLVGLGVGVVGFFVVPVVGLFLGFVLGVLLAERVRLGDNASAWAATKVATRAALTSVGIELAAAVVIGGAWIVAAITLD